MALVVDGLFLALGVVVLAWLAKRLGQPALLGMLFAGVLVAALDITRDLPGPGLDQISSPLRLAVLAVVLLRAGLGISLTELRSAGALGVRVALIPLLGDAALVTVGSILLLRLEPAVALVLGFLVAAISPAIVIPGLLDLLSKRKGETGGEGRKSEKRSSLERRRVLNSLLVGAPLDNILALLLMGVALDAALLDVGFSMDVIGLLFWKVGGGLVLGVATGATLGLLVRFIEAKTAGNWSKVLLLSLGATGVVLVGLQFNLSFVLALISLGALVRFMAPKSWEGVAEGFRKIWDVAQYVLFGLIGAALNLEPVIQAGLAMAAVIAMGQLGRATGSLLATVRSGLSGRSRLACILAYVPKATIQASFAALPLDRGLASGDLILTTAVLAVVITAPLGVVSLHRGVDRLLNDGNNPE